MRRKTANKEDVSYELRNKLYDKYKLKLTPQVALLLVNELVKILKVMVLSRYYDKINLEGFGFFKFRKRPARKLSGNLPSTKGKIIHLPERFQLTFTPQKTIKDEIDKFKD